MNTFKNMRLSIALSFLIGVIVLISGLSLASIIYTVDSLENVYNKSMKIRAAVFEANISLFALERAMKDVALSNNKQELDAALNEVSRYYTDFQDNIETAAKLDEVNVALINKIKKAFDEWTPMRERVIEHVQKGEYDKVADMKITGANQVRLIDGYMDDLLARTQEEADDYYTTSKTRSSLAIIFLILLTFLATIIAVVIALAVNSARKKYEKELYEEKEYFRVAIHSIGDGVIVTDTESTVTLLNPVAEKLTGWRQEDAIGKPFLQVFNVAHEDPSQSIKNPVEEVLITDTICELSNHAVLTSVDGVKRHVADSAAPVKDINSTTMGVVLVFRDVTEKKKYIDNIKYLSIHDGLTGLHNRLYFEEEIKRLEKERQYPITIIIGDINGLKLTNDVFGHSLGDMLIKAIADILRSSCRSEDVIARWGGDEYILCLPRTSESEAERISERILELCEKHKIEFNETIIRPSISIGIATKKGGTGNIDNTIKTAEINMYKHKLLESKSIHSSIINSMQQALSEKSLETKQHADRLVEYCRKIGERLNLSKSQQDELELFALMHDIGKISIDRQILLKPDKLSSDEWLEIKRHPEIGYRVAKSAPELSRIADYILSHHERWDGRGYPQGLAGESIPLFSRILAVVDSFDAMTSDRPYRESMTLDEAKEELINNAGTQFDPEIARIMLEVLGSCQLPREHIT